MFIEIRPDIRDRYILLSYPKSFTLWDRYEKKQVGGFLRNYDAAQRKCVRLNQTWVVGDVRPSSGSR